MKPVLEPLITNPRPTIPVVASIPHSSNFVPHHVRNQFPISDEELAEEHRRLVDWFTDELYAPIVVAGGCSIRYNVSRFVIDPERFDDDSQECMFERGMGVVYTHGTGRQRIRREIAPHEREEMLAQFYRPYHEALTRQVQQVLEVFGRCVFVDCHSYQEHPLPYEIYGDAPRADVVFGDDATHTPGWIREEVSRLTTEAGYTFGVNRPFAGTVVPLPVYGDTRVTSFMLEINRRTYMDERTTSLNQGYESMRRLIGSIAERVAHAD